jgi:hypothetical protein
MGGELDRAGDKSLAAVPALLRSQTAAGPSVPRGRSPASSTRRRRGGEVLSPNRPGPMGPGADRSQPMAGAPSTTHAGPKTCATVSSRKREAAPLGAGRLLGAARSGLPTQQDTRTSRAGRPKSTERDRGRVPCAPGEPEFPVAEAGGTSNDVLRVGSDESDRAAMPAEARQRVTGTNRRSGLPHRCSERAVGCGWQLLAPKSVADESAWRPIASFPTSQPMGASSQTHLPVPKALSWYQPTTLGPKSEGLLAGQATSRLKRPTSRGPLEGEGRLPPVKEDQ